MGHEFPAKTSGRVSDAIARVQSQRQAATSQRRDTRIVSVFAIGALLLFADAGGQAMAEPRLTSEQAARIRDICSNTMEMRPGEVHFDVCVSALSTSLAQRLEGHTIRANRMSCETKGLHPGSSEFDVCVANLENLQSGMDGTTVQNVSVVANSAMPPNEPVSASSDNNHSDVHSPPAVRFARARLSCAQLGLDPQSLAFGNCVADLDTALFGLDHEPN